MRCSPHALALACALACGPALAASPGAAGDDVRGTYRIRGTAHVDAVTPLGRTTEARGDASVRAGAGATILLRLASRGQSCELTATRARDGGLSFATGQRCAFDLRDPDTRGHVEARLRSGSGRLRERHLALDLSFELSGVVALRTAAGLEALGIPPSWTPDLPVNGGASLRAEGDRDESRAAGR